jgi:hypothetical protein
MLVSTYIYSSCKINYIYLQIISSIISRPTKRRVSFVVSPEVFGYEAITAIHYSSKGGRVWGGRTSSLQGCELKGDFALSIDGDIDHVTLHSSKLQSHKLILGPSQPVPKVDSTVHLIQLPLYVAITVRSTTSEDNRSAPLDEQQQLQQSRS